MPTHSIAGLNALILGGSGFIGKHLCRALVDAGAHVRGFANVLPTEDGVLQEIGHSISWTIADFADADAVRSAMEGIDVVFHLVSTTIPATSNADLAADLTSNVLPTLNALEAAQAAGVQRIVFVSSGGTVYGVPEQIPIPETHPTRPICGYGIHKLTIEKYLHLYKELYGLEYRVLRLSNPYGIEQVANRPQGVIGNFIYKALHGNTLEIWGDGSVVRDYVYIEDVMDSFLSIVNHEGPSRTFNIGSGQGHSLLDISHVIEEAAGRTLDVTYGDARDVDVPVNILDVTLARRELGWAPHTSLSDGVRELVRFFTKRSPEVLETFRSSL